MHLLNIRYRDENCGMEYAVFAFRHVDMDLIEG